MERKKRKINSILRISVLIIIIALIIPYIINLYNINKIKRSDIFLSVEEQNDENYSEKKNNPDLCYQTLSDYKYFMYHQNLYKINKRGKIKKIINDVQNFLVVEDSIIYCTVMDASGNKMCVCDLDGNHVEEMCDNVDYFTVGSNSNLITVISHVQDWTLAQINTKTKKINILDTTYSVSTKFGCFYKDEFIGTDDYTLDTVNIETGEADRLTDFYGRKKAYAQVTSVYVHNGILYYGLLALEDKDDAYTGLWKFDLSSKKSDKVMDDAVWDICFVGDKCFVNKRYLGL